MKIEEGRGINNKVGGAGVSIIAQKFDWSYTKSLGWNKTEDHRRTREMEPGSKDPCPQGLSSDIHNDSMRTRPHKSGCS